MKIMDESADRLSAVTVPEVKQRLEDETTRLKRLRNPVRIDGRVVSDGTLLNAIVLYFLSFDPARREAIAREFLDQFSAIRKAAMSGDAPQSDGGEVVPDDKKGQDSARDKGRDTSGNASFRRRKREMPDRAYKS